MSDRRNRDDDEDDRPARRRGGRDDDDEDRGSRRSSGSGFRYRARSVEDVWVRAERNTYGTDSYLKDDVRMFKAKGGDNTVRILPATWDDAKHYGLDVFLHQGIGADRASYLCLDKMKGKPCPICEARKRAAAEGDEEYANQLRPQQRLVAYVIDRAREREGALAWSMSARQDSDINRLASDKSTGEVLNVDSPTEGYDLTFTREGEGMKTRYSGFSFSRRPSDLDNDKALDFAVEHPLPDQLIFYSYDHIAKAFAGTRPRSTDDDDADDKPKRRAVKDDDDDKPKRRASRDDDDDKPAPRRKVKPEVTQTWDEVHELKFGKLAQLVEDHDLDIDPEASRNDEDLADQICEALDIPKRAKRRAVDDDDPPRRRPSRDDDDDEPPARRKLREARDKE